MSIEHPGKSSTGPAGDENQNEVDGARNPVKSDQPADEPRGGDEVRRELGPGDGDDPPPNEDDEPLRDN